MSRLIDADKLLECMEASMLNNTHRNGNAALCHVSEHRHFIEMIVEQPTVFDVEEVIEQLKALPRGSTWNHNSDNINRDKAIEIVKRGGRDEK